MNTILQIAQVGRVLTSSIVEATWQAGLLAILVAIVCRVVPRIPARCRAAMWLVVLIRLLAPAVPQSNISLFNLGGIAAPVYSSLAEPRPSSTDSTARDGIANRDGVKTNTRETRVSSRPSPVHTAAASTSPASNGRMIKTATTDLKSATNPSRSGTASAGLRLWPVRKMAFAIWGLGVSMFALRFLATGLALRRLLRNCTPVEQPEVLQLLDGVRNELGMRRRVVLWTTADKIAPALTGILRPKIVLSTATLAVLSDAELRWLLRHECAHVRRWDVLNSRLWWCARAVHWFNPLVWWAHSRAQAEAEFACDERMLTLRSGPSAYGQSLLRVAELLIDLKPVPASVGLLTRGPGLARRIVMIANYRRQSRLGTATAVLLVLGLAAAGLTGAVEDAPPEKQAASQEKQEQKAAKDEPVKDEPVKVKRIVTVVVVDGDDRPIPQADIHVGLWAKDPAKGNSDYVCDDKGQASIELPYSYDLLRIWATKDGHVPMFAQWWPKYQADGHKLPAEYTFRLEKGTEIGGFIKNEDGEPIAGAKVEVMVSQPPNPQQLMTRLSVSTWLAEGDGGRITDDRGYWSLDTIPNDDKFRIQVKTSHPDYLDDQVWAAAQKDQGIDNASLRKKDGTITMSRGVALRGTVVDPEGTPIAGAVVIHGEDPYLQTGSQEVLTNEKGIFELPRLASEPTTVTVLAEGWSPQMTTEALKRNIEPVRFQMKKGRTIRIRFVDSDGKPIPRAYVGIAKWRGKQSLYNHRHPNVLDTKIPGRADERGVYIWKWAPEDEVEYRFESEGFVDRRGVTLVAGDSHEIVLGRPVVVSGKVTDAETGEPIPFFKVRPASGPRAPRAGPETQAGKNGKYEVNITRRSPLVFVIIEAEGYVPQQSDLFPGFKEGTFEFNCKLKKVEE